MRTAFAQRGSGQFRSAGRRPGRDSRPSHPFSIHALSVFVGLLLVCPVNGAEVPLVLPVWPGAVPGDYGTIGPERVRAPSEAPTKNAKWITGVTNPTLTVFRPAKDKNTGRRSSSVRAEVTGIWPGTWKVRRWQPG